MFTYTVATFLTFENLHENKKACETVLTFSKGAQVKYFKQKIGVKDLVTPSIEFLFLLFRNVAKRNLRMFNFLANCHDTAKFSVGNALLYKIMLIQI